MRADAVEGETQFRGLWAFDVSASGAKYRYISAFADGAYTATGDVPTFDVDSSGANLHGPGTYTLSDLAGKITFRETFQAKGSKINVI